MISAPYEQNKYQMHGSEINNSNNNNNNNNKNTTTKKGNLLRAWELRKLEKGKERGRSVNWANLAHFFLLFGLQLRGLDKWGVKFKPLKKKKKNSNLSYTHPYIKILEQTAALWLPQCMPIV